jgi:hypothetical protein
VLLAAVERPLIARRTSLRINRAVSNAAARSSSPSTISSLSSAIISPLFKVFWFVLVPLYSTRLKSPPMARMSSDSLKNASELVASLYSNRRETLTVGAIDSRRRRSSAPSACRNQPTE